MSKHVYVNVLSHVGLLLQVSHWFFLSRLIQANAKMTIVMSSVTVSRAMMNDSEPTNTEELGGDVGFEETLISVN